MNDEIYDTLSDVGAVVTFFFLPILLIYWTFKGVYIVCKYIYDAYTEN